MTSHILVSRSCDRFIRRACAAVFALGFILSLGAAEAAKKSFNLPAGDAAVTLKAFTQQSGEQIVYPVEQLRGVKTNAVQGEFAARDALNRLLDGTGLVVMQDEKTGALAVRRDPGPNAPRAAQTSSDRPTSQSKVEDGKLVLEKVEVTGVRDTGIINQGIIPREENQAVRYNVLDRAAIDRSGASSLPELLLRQISQAANYGTGAQATFNAQMGLLDGIAVPADRLNLRGLGSNQTLVMVNGRRLYGNETDGPDISRIPLSAVERVEISPSSGSAIYGANAMAGIINLVLRKNYNGSELTGYFGGAQGGAEEVRLGLFHGRNFNDGRTNVTISAEYKKINPLSLGDRGYHLRALTKFVPGSAAYASQILPAFISPLGTVVRTPATAGLGIPGNPTAAFAAVPAGSTGTGLTPASFSATAGTANLGTARLDQTNLTGPLETVSFFSTLEHQLRGDRLGFYAEASYRWADNGAGRFSDLIPNMTLTATNPFNPFRTGVTPGFVGSSVNVYVVPADLPDAYQGSTQRTMRFVMGLKGKFALFGDRTFKWSGDASWDRDETEANTVRYTAQLRIAAASGVYNPLRDLAGAMLLPADELAKLRSNLESRRHPEITATNWRINGEVFDAWGGPVAVSLGSEFRYEYQYSASRYTYGAYADLPPANGSSASKFASSRVQTNRRSYAAYLEAGVPLVGERNRRPLLHSLDLSAAMRYEKYDDFDAAHPPMVAVKWAPVRDIALRAQYSEGFQPPTQSQLFSAGSLIGPSSAFMLTYVDRARPGLPNTSALTIISGGGNRDLRPETSDTWDAGIILTPRWLPGLNVNVAYFRYDKFDLATTVTVQENIDVGRFTRGANLSDDPAGVPGPIIQVVSPVVNVSRQFTDGFDYALDYTFGTPWGRVKLTGDATQTMRFNRQTLPTSPVVETVGDLGFLGSVPIKWRGKLGLAWSRDRWAAAWNARYFGSYVVITNDPTPAVPTRPGYDGPNVPRSIEHDVQFSYSVPARDGRGWHQWLGATKWTVGAMNVFDRDPSYQTNRSALWYSAFNDPRQRFLYLEVKKSL